MLDTGGQIQIQNIQTTKQERSKYTDIRSPDSEDDQRNGKSASVTERIVGPDAAGIIHYIVQSAQTCDHTSHAGSDVFVPGYVDTGCICGIGALTDCS